MAHHLLEAHVKGPKRLKLVRARVDFTSFPLVSEGLLITTGRILFSHVTGTRSNLGTYMSSGAFIPPLSGRPVSL